MKSTTLSSNSTLLKRLRELPFDAFAALVSRFLPALGYQQVQFAGRRDFKGRNGKDGAAGYDLSATKCGRKVLVQLKQFGADHPIYQRSLDELRGVTLRSSAAEALLITTSSFSPSVDREAHRLTPITPITTLSGEELTEYLTHHRIGVTRAGEIDESLFSRLTKEAKGNSPGDCTGASFVVTVGVKRLSRRSHSRA